ARGNVQRVGCAGPMILRVEIVRHREARIRLRVVRVELDCAAQKSDDLIEYLAILLLTEQQLPPTKEKVVRLQIRGWGLGNPRRLARRQPYLESLDDVPGDLVLNRENVCEVAIVAFRPHMSARGGIDQLCGDSDAVARAADRTFQHRADAKLASDRTDV